ncbi:MAG TPA: YceI family protein [Terriglobia bacterium]|nr:YceI family protein [Terriglobia bacterium]
MSPQIRVAICLIICLLAPGIHNATAQRAQAGAAVRFDIAPETRASYHVREQLLGFDLPNDAVGVTSDVFGGLTLSADGAIGSGSRISVDLRTLKSDQEQRDTFLRDRTIQTNRFPTADFVPRRIEGLSMPLPTKGSSTFKLIGDMTAHGVTAELSWTLELTFDGDRVTGKAKTSFPFKTFNLTIPRLPGILSLDDNIRLELDLALRRAATG